MRNDPESIIHGLYAAWTLQDIDATLAYCHDYVRYEVVTPDGRKPCADNSGKVAVRAYLEAMCSVWRWEAGFIEPGPFVVEGNLVIREQFKFRATHRKSGLEFKGTRRHVWTVEDGRVAQCREHVDVYKLEAFLRMAEAHCRSAVLGMSGLAVLSGLAGIV